MAFQPIPVRTPAAVQLLEANLVWHSGQDPVLTYRVVVEMDDGSTDAVQGTLDDALLQVDIDTVINWLNKIAQQAGAEIIPT